MATPNPQRAEVALAFGDGQLILRPSFPAIAKLKPYLFGASDEVKAERRRWLAVTQAQYGTEPPPPSAWGGTTTCSGRSRRTNSKRSRASILILAEEHHPELTFEKVMDESPSYGLIWRAFMDLSEYFHWRPGQAPEVPKDKDERPFDPRTLLRRLSILRPRTASARPNSGH